MATSTEIKQRANALAGKTDVNSITPKEVGGIMYDLASHGENVLRNGGTLGVRKVYESVAAMEADSTNPKDFWGDPIKKGNLVVIYDGTTTGVDNNKIYAFMKPGWELATHLDAGYATKAETDAKLAELGSEVGSLSAEMTDYTSSQKRAYIYGDFEKGTRIYISASGSADVNAESIVVRYDDVSTTIGYLSINSQDKEFELSQDTRAIVCMLNNSNIIYNGDIIISVSCGLKKEVKDIKVDLDLIETKINDQEKQIENKVEKEEGKSLSTNDFSDRYKNSIEETLGYRSEVVNEFSPITAYKDIEVTPILEGATIESVYVGANGSLFFKDENLNNVSVVASDGIVLSSINGNNLDKVAFPLKVDTTIKYFRLGGTAEDQNIRVMSVYEKKGLIEEIEGQIEQVNKIGVNTNTDLSQFALSIGTTPMATWVDDDGILLNSEGKGVHTIVKPVCDELGIKPTIAVIPSTTKYEIDGVSVTQSEYLKDRQKEGYHMTAHPNHTGWYGSSYDLTVVEPKLIDCLVYCQDNGFLHSDLLVYPGSSSTNQDVVEIVKKWCQCGIVAGLGNPNHLGDNTKWQIRRTFIDFESCYNAYNGTSGFTNAVDWYKSKIDSAFENGDWIIFGTHSSLIADSEDTSNPNVSTKGNLRIIMEYAKSKMKFYTLWDAWNRRKILFDMKEYCQ